jgi:hypothetical protein
MKMLAWLHGERPKPFEVAITYAVAVFAAVVVVLEPGARPSLFQWWETAIAAVIAADLAGGVVANFTGSTNDFYKARPKLRIVFLLSHLIHPAVLYLIMNGPIEIWAAIPAFTVAAALVVNALPERVQPSIAAALFAVGVMIAFTWHVITPPLVWFTPLFLAKLVLGFAVRR